VEALQAAESALNDAATDDAATDGDWRSAIRTVLADSSQPELVFQPIVDLHRGVIAGYEALSRFRRLPRATPDAWFAAADRLGVGAELEARVVRAALQARDSLPPECFLTVNVSPHLLCQPVLSDVLTGVADLSRIVLELTEHVQVEDSDALSALLVRLRAAGATVALDDAGSGYSGLQQMALIRPEIIKIDRALVDHVDRDEVKLALAELLGRYAGRLDAVVLAEGVERDEELVAIARMGIPLAQGWLFGRESPQWSTLSPELAQRIRDTAVRSHRLDHMGGLMQRAAVVYDDQLTTAAQHFSDDAGLDLLVVLDQHERAVCMLRRQVRAQDSSHAVQVLPISLRAPAQADLAEVATRAMTRSPEHRFDPIVCNDAYGAYLGIVRPEHMMLRLAELKNAPPPADA